MASVTITAAPIFQSQVRDALEVEHSKAQATIKQLTARLEELQAGQAGAQEEGAALQVGLM